MIIVCQTLLRNTKILGITLFPFIILRKEELRNHKILINHEKIHLRQQIEMGIIFFYLWYVLEFFYWFLKYRHQYTAYRRISFEREAFANESNFHYLKDKKIWSFFKYL